MFILVAPQAVREWLSSRYNEGEITWSQPRDKQVPRPGLATLLVGRGRSESQAILGVGRFGRHGTGATDLDRAVRLDEVFVLDRPIPVAELLASTPNHLRQYVEDRLGPGGELPDRTALAVRSALQELDHELGMAISRIEALRDRRPVSGEPAVRWGQERDAVSLALRLGDFPALDLTGWIEPEPDEPLLAGLLRDQEATMIDYDASRFPGMRAMRQTHTSIHVFRDGDRRLEVLNANANGVEGALGTDLLYYNHGDDAFVLVQYKKTTDRGDLTVDERLLAQMARMDRFVGTSRAAASPGEFRMGEGNAAWIKVVKPEPLRTSADSLLKGMYLPTPYCHLLLQDPCTEAGAARVLSIERVERYVTNGMFVALVREGWVGTVGLSRGGLKTYVREALRGRRSVVLAEEYGDQSPFERRRATSRRERVHAERP